MCKAIEKALESAGMGIATNTIGEIELMVRADEEIQFNRIKAKANRATRRHNTKAKAHRLGRMTHRVGAWSPDAYFVENGNKVDFWSLDYDDRLAVDMTKVKAHKSVSTGEKECYHGAKLYDRSKRYAAKDECRNFTEEPRDWHYLQEFELNRREYREYIAEAERDSNDRDYDDYWHEYCHEHGYNPYHGTIVHTSKGRFNHILVFDHRLESQIVDAKVAIIEAAYDLEIKAVKLEIEAKKLELEATRMKIRAAEMLAR